MDCSRRKSWGLLRAGLITAVASGGIGCASAPLTAPEPAAVVAPVARPAEAKQLRVAELAHAAFQQERERLEADLRQAEQELVALESGRRGRYSFAEAVSALAAAKSQVQIAAREVPWQTEEIARMYALLAEAERQLNHERLHTASFLTSRASRLALALVQRRDALVKLGHARRVGTRANLRSGPSTRFGVLDVLERDTPVVTESVIEDWLLVLTADGLVGWVHEDLVED